jgi:hypothetical protein
MTIYYVTQQVFDNISKSLNLETYPLKYNRAEVSVESMLVPYTWNSNLAANDPIRYEYRKRTLEQFSDPVKRQRHLEACLKSSTHSDKIWINNGNQNKRIKEDQLTNFPGWSRGRLIPREKIDIMIANRTTTRNPVTGKFIKKMENI